MAKSANYWKERMKALEDTQYKKTTEYYNDLQKQFRMAQKNLQMDIEYWYQRLAANNDISLAAAKKLLDKNDLEEFHWTVEEYIKRGEENDLNKRWMKQLENASARVHINRLEAMKLQIQQHAEILYQNYEHGTSKFLSEIYEDGYYRTAYEIAKGTSIGISFSRINTTKIDKIVNTPWAQDGKAFSDRIWQNKDKLVRELHTELTQSLIRGENPDMAAKRLAKTMGSKLTSARTLVYTESAAISSAAQKDSLQELGVEEFEVVETLDSHTCSTCGDMDGRHFPMKDFEIGVTAPPFHPRCRGCTCPYFDDEFTTGERIARGEDGKQYYVPADMTYKQWQKSFVEGDKSGLKPIEPTTKDLEKKFEELTDGYSYDDFMKDFGSIEEGFEGADAKDIIKAKNISTQIEKLRNKSNTASSTIPTKEESIKALKDIGIDFMDKSREPVSDTVVGKFSKFITDFEQTHSNFFNMNEPRLQSISVFDDVVVGGKNVAGAYYSESQSIKLMKKSIVSRPTSKFVTYSNSDDYELHFLAHEYGHYVADSLEKTLSVKDSDIIQNTLIKYFDGDIFRTKTSNLVDVLGSYGARNPQEAFAEAFAEAYTCKEPRKFAKLFKEELEDALEKSVKSSRLEVKNQPGAKRIDKSVEQRLNEKGVQVNIDGAGKYHSEAQQCLEHLDNLMNEYNSTAVSYYVGKPSGAATELGSAYMLNGQTSILVDPKAYRVNSAIDALRLGEKQPLGITYHEFAHSLSQSREKTDHEFWKSIRKIKKEYEGIRGKREWFDVKISDYASKDVDEFLAEAFTQAKLRENPSPYSKQVLEIVDKYFKKKPVENISESSTMISGAISGARNPLSDKAKEHAQKYYGLVRSMKTDVAKISKVTGMSEDEVQSVKNFIFLEKHDLGGKELEYFQPDYMMAESWQRLIEGKPKQHDITLLKHEILEKELMEKGLSQEEAHIQASKRYNYSKEAGEYYAKIEKYKD